MSPEEKKPELAEDEWNDEDGEDRPTRSVPAIVLAELYGRAPSSPPPASDVAPVPTNGMDRMIITDAMLGKAPKVSTKTAKLPPLKPRQ